MKAFFVSIKFKGDIMKKMQLLLAMTFMALCAISCQETSVNHEGPAHLVLENLTTGAKISFDGTFVNGTSEPLIVKNSDSLEVLFIPEQNYVKYGFKTKFTVFNKEISDNEYPFLYKMQVKDIVPGTYTISCEAKVDTPDASISESGELKVTVME